jgi:hypothetical protein
MSSAGKASTLCPIAKKAIVSAGKHLRGASANIEGIRASNRVVGQSLLRDEIRAERAISVSLSGGPVTTGAYFICAAVIRSACNIHK